jgi:hypothetical protein
MENWVKQHPTPILMAGLVLFFFICWPLGLMIESHWSGWASLAERFTLTGKFHGTTWQFQSGHMRFSYLNLLTVGADAKGLYLAITISIFSPAHPPLLIPWYEISVTRTDFLFFRRIKLELGRNQSVPLRISGVLGDKLRSAAGSNWPRSVG